jgi:hypothetical protein
MLNLIVIVGLDVRVWVADSPTFMGNNVGDALRANGQFSNLQKLVASFLRRDTMDRETALQVVKKAEVFAGLFDGDDV